MNKPKTLVAFVLTVFTANLILAGVLSNNDYLTMTASQSRTPPSVSQLVWRITDYDQPMADRAMVVRRQNNQPLEDETFHDFIGQVLSVLRTEQSPVSSNCNYVIERMEPEVEIWLLSYFPDKDGCIGEGWHVRVVILQCKSCLDDTIVIRRLSSL